VCGVVLHSSKHRERVKRLRPTGRCFLLVALCGVRPLQVGEPLEMAVAREVEEESGEASAHLQPAELLRTEVCRSPEPPLILEFCLE